MTAKTTARRTVALKAEAAVAEFLAVAFLWPDDERKLKAALEILRKEAHE